MCLTVRAAVVLTVEVKGHGANRIPKTDVGIRYKRGALATVYPTYV